MAGPPDPTQLAQFMAAEKQIESGNYSQPPNEAGASGAYQWIPSTWSEQATAAGYGQYANEQAYQVPGNVQEAVAAYAFTQYYEQYGDWSDVAKAWYAGGGFASENQTASQYGGPSIDQYATDVLSLMPSMSGGGVGVGTGDAGEGGPGGEAIAAGGGTLADYVVSAAQAFVNLGVPYAWGGTPSGDTAQSLATDCSGMVQYIYGLLGVNLPRTSQTQAQTGQSISYANIQPGDIIIYGGNGGDYPDGTASHEALYIGNGQQIAETTPGTAVSIQSVDVSHIYSVQNVANLSATVTNIPPQLQSLYEAGDISDPGATVSGGNGAATTGAGGGTANDLLNPNNNTNTPASVNDPGQYTNMSNVIAYINTNYPDMSWLLNIPDIANVLEGIVQNLLETGNTAGLSESAIAQQVENTTWWKTNSGYLQQYDANKATNPADYDPSVAFNIPGSILNQNLAVIQNTAATQGVTITTAQAQALAVQMTEFQWNTQQIQQGIGALVSVNATNAGQGGWASQYSSITGQPTTTDAQSIVQQLDSIAGNYAQLLSDSALQQWASQIASGTSSLNAFTAAMAQQAAGQYPTLGAGLSQGQSVSQLLQPQINQMASLLEIDPSQVETGLLTNPQYAKILNGGQGGKTPAMTMSSGDAVNVSGGAPMTTSEVAQYARSLPQWATTQNARDTGAQASQAIIQAFGVSPL